MIGAAVIGLNQGMNHCQGYSKAKNCELLAVSDLIDERLNKAQQQFEVETYKNYKDLLKRKDIDVVSVTVPPFLHTPITLDVIASGKNVMVEKPLALKLEDCDMMLSAAQHKGVKLSVQMNKRYHPLFVDVKQLIDGGELGRIAAVSASYWRFPFGVTSKPGQWSGRSKLAGNILFEDGIHWIDLMQWFGGEVSAVYSVDNGWVREEFDFSQTVFASMRFRDGGIGDFSQTINGFGNRGSFWIIGTKACILANLIYRPEGDTVEMLFKRHQKDLEADRRLDLVKTKRYRGIFETYDESIKAHFEDFVNRLECGKEPSTTGSDGRHAVEVCLALEESAKREKIINLPLSKTPSRTKKEVTNQEVDQYYKKVAEL